MAFPLLIVPALLLLFGKNPNENLPAPSIAPKAKPVTLAKPPQSKPVEVSKNPPVDTASLNGGDYTLEPDTFPAPAVSAIAPPVTVAAAPIYSGPMWTTYTGPYIPPKAPTTPVSVLPVAPVAPVEKKI